MSNYTYLTDDELFSQLQTRDDLSELELELLDRLIRTRSALDDLSELEFELLDRLTRTRSALDDLEAETGASPSGEG